MNCLALGFLLSGCLAGTGTATGLLATSGGEKGPKKEPAPPSPEAMEAARLPGTFQLSTEGKAIGVALGDFIPGPETGSECLDAAMIFDGKTVVEFIAGDCLGRLLEHSTFDFGGSAPLGLASIKVDGLPRTGLLIVTSDSLGLIHWTEEGGFQSSSFVQLGSESSSRNSLRGTLRRDMTLGDFDGDGNANDVAVMISEESTIEFYRITADGPTPLDEPLTRLQLSSEPISITAADFYPFPENRSDLCILVTDIRNTEGTSLQFHFARLNGWCPDPDVTVECPDPASRLAKGELQLDDNGPPDVALIRADGTSTALLLPCPDSALCADDFDAQCHRDLSQEKKLIDCNDKLNGSWSVNYLNRGGGHFSPDATEIIMMRLPGGREDTLDRVTIDSKLKAIVCSYHKDAVDTGTKFAYDLPWEGRALAAGDLNGDGNADLVAACTEGGRTLLCVLVADSPSNPFRYSSGSTLGEKPPPLTALADIGFGFGGNEREKPFFAAADRDNDELMVFHLDSDKINNDPPGFVVSSEERIKGIEIDPRSVAVFDFDSTQGDDVVVGCDQAIYFLRNQGADPNIEAPFFSQAPEKLSLDDLVMLASEANDPNAMEFASDLNDRRQQFQFRKIVAGPLDGKGAGHLSIPINVKKTGTLSPKGWICVVKDLGLVSRSVHFFRTRPSPRSIAIANLNNDYAPDLIIGFDGDTNGIQLLFGNPCDPGSFFDSETENNQPQLVDVPCERGNLITTAMERMAPQFLPGLAGKECGEAKVSYVATVNDLLSFQHSIPRIDQSDGGMGWPLATWIVAANDQFITRYCQSCLDGQGTVCFNGPVVVTTLSSDPEEILVLNLFATESSDPSPDLAIVDEASTGSIIYLEGSMQSLCPEWHHDRAADTIIGAPQRVIPIKTVNSLCLAVASRSEQEIVILQKIEEDGKVHFSQLPGIPVRPKNRQGSSLGLTVAREGNETVIALSNEETDGPDGESIDVVGSSGSSDPGFWEMVRMSDDSSKLGILLGHFQGNDPRVAMLAFEIGGSIACYPGLMREEGSGDKGNKSPLFGPRIQMTTDIPGALVDWEAVPVSETKDWLGLATEADFVALFDTGQGAEKVEAEWESKRSYSGIRRFGFGWAGAARGRGAPAFCAIVDSRGLWIEGLDSGNSDPVALFPEEIRRVRLDAVGCRDLNGDGREDVIVVDGGAQSVFVFLATKGGSNGPNFKLPPRSVAYEGILDRVVDVAFLEANGDGRLDFCLGLSSGEIFIFPGNGHGTLGSPARLFAAPDLEGLEAADLDHDGIDEILAAVALPGLIVLPGMHRQTGLPVRGEEGRLTLSRGE